MTEKRKIGRNCRKRKTRAKRFHLGYAGRKGNWDDQGWQYVSRKLSALEELAKLSQLLLLSQIASQYRLQELPSQICLQGRLSLLAKFRHWHREYRKEQGSSTDILRVITSTPTLMPNYQNHCQRQGCMDHLKFSGVRAVWCSFCYRR